MNRNLARLLGLLTLALAALGTEAEAQGQFDEVVRLAPAPESAFWTAKGDFTFEWEVVDLHGGVGPSGYGYRFRDPTGNPLGPEGHNSDPGSHRLSASLPRTQGEPALPGGRYRFELWPEHGDIDGKAAMTFVYFDESRPAPPRLLAPAGWVRAGSPVELQVEPSAGPPPSGIRGYAVELEHRPGTGPCDGRSRCEASEVDISGEAGGSISLGPLAEQVNLARVVTVSGSGMSSALAASAELHVDGTPPRVAVAGAPRGWAGGPVAIAARAVDERSGMAAAGVAGPLTAIAVDGAIAKVAAGDSAAAVVHDEGVHTVGAYARDAVGNFSDGGDLSDPPVSTLVRIDETPPRLAFADSESPAEPERLVAVIADSLSGPDPARGSIAVRPAGSSQPFEPIPTSSSGSRLTASWDSDSYPAGAYEFRASGFDLAGNSASTELRASGGRMILSNPVKTPTAIASGFGGRQLVWHRCHRTAGALRCRRQLIGPFEARPDSRSVAYGRGVPVGGRLTGTGGQPLANLPVRITETFGPGAVPAERETTVLTDAGGVFLARLAPGPSRQIEVGFAGNPVLTRSSGRELQLGVRAAVRLHSSAATATIGGAPVVFSGVVAHDEAAIPPTGLPIELQFRLPDLPWSEFRTVQTGPAGRFRYAYSFSDDDSRGVRFQFRARLAAQPGWPFEPGTSRPVVVTGR
ncbi:MAG TPA: hypothetical protein VFJ57_06660 [Solirubrobacterales bacterium]|nr:hypothetical protein [Solirubrobacterales bacterium]